MNTLQDGSVNDQLTYDRLKAAIKRVIGVSVESLSAIAPDEPDVVAGVIAQCWPTSAQVIECVRSYHDNVQTYRHDLEPYEEDDDGSE